MSASVATLNSLLKKSLSQKDQIRFQNANMQDWFLLELYKEAKAPKNETFIKKVVATLDMLEEGDK